MFVAMNLIETDRADLMSFVNGIVGILPVFETRAEAEAFVGSHDPDAAVEIDIDKP